MFCLLVYYNTHESRLSLLGRSRQSEVEIINYLKCLSLSFTKQLFDWLFLHKMHLGSRSLHLILYLIYNQMFFQHCCSLFGLIIQAGGFQEHRSHLKLSKGWKLSTEFYLSLVSLTLFLPLFLFPIPLHLYLHLRPSLAVHLIHPSLKYFWKVLGVAAFQSTVDIKLWINLR